MNKLLTILFLLIGMASFSQCCTYTLTMSDSWGDNWNGGLIDILVDGTEVLTDQYAVGTGSVVTFSVCTGQSIQWNYTSGVYENENSFTITDETGTVIDGDGNVIDVGLFTATSSAVCPETCSDGILNNGETSIDCGGINCIPCSCTNGIMDGTETAIDYGGDCGDCGDGIMNGAETGVDCGGLNCLPCTTNNTVTNSTNCCDNTPQATVYPTNCDQIGTSVYNVQSPIVNMTSTSISAGCMPSTTPTGCGGVTGTGSWTQLDLTCPIDYVQLTPVPPYGVAPGNHTTYHSYFQGTDCANLTFIECQVAMDFSSGSYYIFESSVTGLDCSQPLWVYTWDSGNKAFNQDYQVVGAVTNTSIACPGSSAIGEACNLGAQGASFSTPVANGVGCSGGNWGSNENTTFYSFTATDVTGSLIIENIICNDGTNGSAQFGVWTSCAAIGTYGADFLGCAVGTGAISLSPLVEGQTYYIAADGFAGDNCTWGFTGTGISLPIELGYFNGYHNGREVELNWGTISEMNNNYFTVQRTSDGKIWESLETVQGAGNSQNEVDYGSIDYEPYLGSSYYRIKQTDYDGRFKYTDIIHIKGLGDLELIKTINLMGQEVNLNYRGIVIDIYSDGTIIKRFKNRY